MCGNVTGVFAVSTSGTGLGSTCLSTNANEAAAMLAMKAALVDSATVPSLSSWTGSDPCAAPQWSYITCTSNTYANSIVSLSLSYTSVSGTIGTQLGLLTALTQLYLAGLSVSGTLPSEVGNLRALSYLYIQNLASLSGTLPASIGGCV